jgi:Uma2 family endonuclease
MVMRPDDYYKGGTSGGYFNCRPLFVVEVLSPSERRSRRLQKIGLYLEAGAGAVVELDYAKRCAYVYRPDENAAEIVRTRITSPFTAELSDVFLNIG